MKTFTKFFVLVAAAAMALASCQKNEITGPETQEVHFTIKADIAETKTFITDKGDKTYTPSWSKEDKIGVLFALEENAKAVDFENTAESGEEATFEGKHAFTVVEGASEVDGYLYAFYPSSAFDKMYSDGGVRLDLKVTQYPTSTSFDPSCDLLIAKPCYYMAEATGEDAEVVIDDMYFARMMSVLRINLNSEFLSNETVKSVSFDADGVDFTGAMKFNLATGEFVGNQSTTQDLSEVKAIYSEEDPIAVAGEKNSAYLVVAPVTIPSGTALTFTIETENYDIVKTIKAPADMEMPAGNIAVINLSIAEENCTARVEDTSDYSGEWLIVNSDLTRAANAWANGNNLPEFVLTTNEGVVLESDGIASCKMIITKEADGYTIQDASGMYLYAAGASDKNHLYGQETKSYWTIEKNETNYVITSLAKADRNILRYNSSNKIFSCYSSGQADVTLYKYSEIIPDTTPSISVAENTNASIGAEGGDLTFTCTIKNLDGETLEVVDESDYLTWTVAENVVTITVAANEAEESRTLNATIKCGSVEVPVTINQSGKPADGETVEYSVTYKVASTTSVSVSGTAPEGSSANFKNTYTSTKEQMTSGNSQTYTLSGYKGCIIKSVTLSMKSNASKGAGTLSLKAGTTTLAEIAAATNFNAWYDNTSFGAEYRDVHVQLINSTYVIGDENVVLVLSGTTNSIYCQSITITYSCDGNGDSGNESETPDVDEPTEPQTYTYTFTSKAWVDETNSWTSGKDGHQMQSGRGVQVTAAASGANATCKTSMSNVSKAVVVYSTNASSGAGKIMLSIGDSEVEQSVTTTGGTTDRNLVFDFSSTSPSGTPKITVTCTTNSIYIKSITFTTK